MLSVGHKICSLISASFSITSLSKYSKLCRCAFHYLWDDRNSIIKYVETLRTWVILFYYSDGDRKKEGNLRLVFIQDYLLMSAWLSPMLTHVVLLLLPDVGGVELVPLQKLA
jgi:hypothetical protein